MQYVGVILLTLAKSRGRREENFPVSSLEYGLGPEPFNTLHIGVML